MKTFELHRRTLSIAGLLVLTLVVGCASSDEGDVSAEPARQPNLVIVFADDLGYGDLSCYGQARYRTPNIDRIAAEGILLSDFYVAQPVCSASRAALLTGCYPNRLGIHGALGPNARHGLDPDETTLAESARQRGYATAIFGKWHLGNLPPFLPTRQGFDHFHGIPYSNDMWPNHPESPDAWGDLPTMEGERIVGLNTDQNEFTGEFARRGAAFIDRCAAEGRPFFLYLPHPMPHVPLHASERFRGSTKAGLYADVIAEIDASVGTLDAALARNGLRDDTLFIFTSDNGPWLSYGDHSGASGPLREGKGTTFEGGVRVPAVMRWPRRLPAGRVVDEPLMTIDLLPTISAAFGLPLPERTIDGRDVWAALGEGKRLEPRALFFYYHANQLEAVRYGRWKLHFPHGYRSMIGREPGQGGTPGKYDYTPETALELYDLERDVGETEDVAASHPDVVLWITALADAKRRDLGCALSGVEGTGHRPPRTIDH